MGGQTLRLVIASTKTAIQSLPYISCLGTPQMPERRPDYRKDRPHGAFLTRLRDHTRNGDRCVHTMPCCFVRPVGALPRTKPKPPPQYAICMCSDALFSELERELRARFDVTDVEEAAVRQEVVDGRLGGLAAWAAASRTRDVVV